MKPLVILCSLLSTIIYSCSGGKPLPEHRVIYDEVSVEDQKNDRSNVTTLQVYNSNLTFQDQTYNGKLFVKRLNRGHYKLAYTTDSDFKLYALEISDSTIGWEYCLTKMDRKVVKKILERNFRAFLALVHMDSPAMVSREERPHTIMGNSENKIYVYWTDNTKTVPYKTIYTSKKETLVIVHYLDIVNGFPKRIKVVDHKSELSMTLVKAN
ncbi:MAG: hypothetical protein CL840_09630 [Crocinitomicaceae bacterium]|nr:hypothetical protein [Crocinitomicaceae bacterium]|tara:strand:+ start:10218 stop:10850 length:633 start_codon:yes stop_codon:yes gene_type:complete